MDDTITDGFRTHTEILALAEGLIASEAYFQFPGTSVTVCLLTTHHGHFEVGSCYYAVPSEFNEDNGRLGARGDAISKLYILASYLHRENTYKAGATLEPAIPAPAVQEVGIGYTVARVPIEGSETRPIRVRPGIIKFIAMDTPPFSPPEELDEAMVETAEDVIAEVITRMYAAVQAERRDRGADAQLAAEIEATRAQTAGAGEAQIAEIAATLHKGDLITADEAARVSGEAADAFKRSDRERDSQVSGDGVEHPETEIEATYLSLGELRGDAK